MKKILLCKNNKKITITKERVSRMDIYKNFLLILLMKIQIQKIKSSLFFKKALRSINYRLLKTEVKTVNFLKLEAHFNPT